jgi:hypothetical protein
MAAANKLRGEVKIKIRGKELTFAATFDAIARIESIVEGSFFGYVQSLNSTSVRVTELARIAAACCKETQDETEIGEAIVEYGLLPFLNGPFSELMARGAGFHESLERTDSGK